MTSSAAECVRFDGFGNESQVGYDSRDRPRRMVDPLGNVRRHRFDVHGCLVAESYERTSTGLGGGPILDPVVHRREHDANGNVIAFVDPAGVRTEQSFDALDRRIATRYADGSSTTDRYDRDDLLVSSSDANGTVRRRSYDGLGRLVRVHTVPGSTTVEGERFELYGYDAAGAVVREANDHCRIVTTRDSLGRAVRESWSFIGPVSGAGGPYMLERDFDAADAVTGLTYPAGRVLAIGRDALGRVERMRALTAAGGLLGTPAQPCHTTWRASSTRAAAGPGRSTATRPARATPTTRSTG